MDQFNLFDDYTPTTKATTNDTPEPTKVAPTPTTVDCYTQNILIFAHQYQRDAIKAQSTFALQSDQQDLREAEFEHKQKVDGGELELLKTTEDRRGLVSPISQVLQKAAQIVEYEVVAFKYFSRISDR